MSRVKLMATPPRLTQRTERTVQCCSPKSCRVRSPADWSGSDFPADELSTSPWPDDAKRYVDDKFAYSLTVPKPWAEATRVLSGSGHDSLRLVGRKQRVAPGFRAGPEPPSAVALADESARAMCEKLACDIQASEIKTVAGKKAMWLVATGREPAAPWTGEGDVETTTHWVAVPREGHHHLPFDLPGRRLHRRLPSFEEPSSRPSIERQADRTAG